MRHSLRDVAAIAEDHVPASHGVHTLEPVAAHVPAGHVAQTAPSAAPSTAEAEPAGQRSHALAASLAAKDPAAQASHASSAPAADEALPGAQGKHAALDVSLAFSKNPAGQSGAQAMAPGAENRPAPHAAHTGPARLAAGVRVHERSLGACAKVTGAPLSPASHAKE